MEQVWIDAALEEFGYTSVVEGSIMETIVLKRAEEIKANVAKAYAEHCRPGYPVSY